jgi:cysteinyl-tRNA synthetase
MSKSLGNFITLKEVLDKFGVDTFRYFFLSTHYRKQLNYTELGMRNAAKATEKLRNTLDNIRDALRSENESLKIEAKDDSFRLKIAQLRKDFEKHMDNDLDSPMGIKDLHAMSKAINDYIAKKPNKGLVREAADVYRELLDVFGLFEHEEEDVGKLTGELIEVIITIREELRKKKLYDLSDKIRGDLKKIGVVLGDKEKGTSWKIEK